MSQIVGMLGNDKTTVQISIEEYKGKTGVDIREWYLGSDKLMHPTSKGLRIQLGMVSQLITFLEQAEAILVKTNKMPSP